MKAPTEIQPIFASPTTRTWMCENGHHGTSERRYVVNGDYSKMFEGSCSGSVRSVENGTEWDCPCECHQPVIDTKPTSAYTPADETLAGRYGAAKEPCTVGPHHCWEVGGLDITPRGQLARKRWCSFCGAIKFISYKG